MPPKRRHEHGFIHGGRLQLDRDTRDVIRTYTRLKLLQAKGATEQARQAHQRMGTQQSLGRLKYCEHIEGWLELLYSQGQHAVPPADWAECWRWTTTDERHGGSGTEQNPTLPGM